MIIWYWREHAYNKHIWGGPVGTWGGVWEETWWADATDEIPFALEDPGENEGRTCWEIRPVIQDPLVTTEPALEQPLRMLGDMYCYTTGPAPIKRVLYNGGHEYWDDEIKTAKINSDLPVNYYIIVGYIPNWQWNEIEFPDLARDIEWKPDCVGNSRQWGFEGESQIKDFFGCTARFKINKEDMDYNSSYEGFGLKAWNCEKDNMQDDSCLVIDLTKQETGFKTMDCGHDGEPCCDDDDARCIDGECLQTNYPDGSVGHTCHKCGHSDDDCCIGGNEECYNDLECIDEKCQECGLYGMQCCPGGRCPGENVTCGEDNECVRCGLEKIRCCDGTCNEGLECVNNQCQESTIECDTPISAYGHCDPENPCGEKTYIIELGKIGVVQFDIKTYTIPDNIQFKYEGSNFLTDCIGTNEEYPIENTYGVWRCYWVDGPAMQCSIDLELQGDSTVVEITVYENCDVSGTESDWEFTVHCPGIVV